MVAIISGDAAHLSTGEHWCSAVWHQDLPHPLQVTHHLPATTHVAYGDVLPKCAMFHHLQGPRTRSSKHFMNKYSGEGCND